MTTEGMETPDSAGWKAGEISITCNFITPDPVPIWIVKMGRTGRYMRASTNQALVSVKDKRLATRFDSPTWAKTLALLIDAKEKPRVVRLISKTEKEIREAREMRAQTWVYKKTRTGNPTTPSEPATVETPPDADSSSPAVKP